ncbi:hypothetical protein KFU94_23845 [Chloroflexi bacterium TSY]|nr:hypothetical protein [Chloroflexi bacterium TSY]
MLREWNQLEAATSYLTKGSTMPLKLVVALKGLISLAWIKQAQGDAEGVLALFRDMDELAADEKIPWPTARVAASQARLWLAAGHVVAAAHWAKTSGLDIDDELTYLHEIDHLTLARPSWRKVGQMRRWLFWERLHQEAQAGERGHG